MTAEILIQAITKNSYSKGSLILVKPEGWSWGGKERLPNYIRLCVTGLDNIGQLEQYIKTLYRNITYEILEHDPEQDFFRVRVFTNPQSIGTKFSDITVSQMNNLLTLWGAKEITDADPGVTFEITALDALNAKGYLNIDDIELTELSYDEESGIHTIEMDYSSNLNLNNIINKLLLAKCRIISQDLEHNKIEFEAYREIMIKSLERAVRYNFDALLSRNTYYLNESYVNEIIAIGGIKDITFTEFQSVIQDIRNG